MSRHIVSTFVRKGLIYAKPLNVSFQYKTNVLLVRPGLESTHVLRLHFYISTMGFSTSIYPPFTDLNPHKACQHPLSLWHRLRVLIDQMEPGVRSTFKRAGFKPCGLHRLTLWAIVCIGDLQVC